MNRDPRDELIEQLQADLARVKERERALRDARRAMVSMLEELNETTDAVKHAEREWEATFDAIGDPLFIHGRDLRIVRANRAYAACAGRPFKEIIGRPYHRIFPVMDRPFPFCLKMAGGQEPGGGEVEPEGGEVILELLDKVYKVRSYPIAFNGEAVYSVHILEDISQEKAVEARLREEVNVTGSLLAVAEATGRTQDVEHLMGDVTAAVARVLRADACFAYLKDRDTHVFVPCQARGLPASRMSLFRTEFLSPETGFIRAMADREDDRVEVLPIDLFGGESSGLFPWVEGAVRMQVIPLTGRTGLSGLLLAFFSDPRRAEAQNLRVIRGIARQVSSALEEARLLTDLQEIFLGMVRTLSNAIDAKSPWTHGHSERVTRYSVTIGQALGFDGKGLEDLRIAGLLHDIGKIGTSDEVLNKPDRLTPEEQKEMEGHSAKGAELLSPIRQIRHIVPWIRHHHERYDGAGYPDGLKGETIPVQSRILSIADTFDAMTARRPYRETPGWDRAFEELNRYSGTQFDPEIVRVFLKAMREKGEQD